MYHVILDERAARELLRLEERARERVEAAINRLARDPRPRGCKLLRGERLYRVRVGGYRIIYAIEDDRLLVLIVKVAHRREAYRRR